MKKTMFLTVMLLLPFILTAQQYRPLPAHISGTQFLQPQNRVNLRPQNVDATQYFSEDFDSGIPSSWTVTDVALNGVVWTPANDYYGSTLNGTPFVMVDSYAGGSVDVDTYLESPVININNGGDPVYLSFEHYFRYWSGNEIGEVEVYDGTNWQVVATYTGQDYGNWGMPDVPEIDVTAYVNPNFKVRFHYYNANYDWYWAVDNVVLFTPNANDLALVWGIPYAYKVNEYMFFSTIVQNLGYQTQNNFTVDLTVLDPSSNVVHTDSYTVTSANLAKDEFYKINFFNAFSPSVAGDYTVVYSLSASDDDNSNNTFSITATIKDFNYIDQKIYTYIAYDADGSGDLNDVGYFNPSDGTYTSVGSISGMIGDYLLGGDFIREPGFLAVSDNLNITYLMDGDGSVYPYGSFPFLNQVITGFADSEGSSESYFSTISALYELTPFLDTLKIGDYNITDPVIVGIAADTSGTVYAIDLNSDKLYTVNTSDASLTEVGPMGVDIEYAQDIGVDPTTNKLYGTLYVFDGSNYISGLYELDTSTGLATLVGSQQVDEYTLCAVSGSPQQSIGTISSDSWRLYPNPAHDLIHLNWTFVPDQIELLDMSGKLLRSVKPVDNQMSMDISQLSKGIYLMRITKGDQVSVKIFEKN